MIQIERLSKQYGRRVALSNVTLSLEPGEVTLLLGCNGAGKSTLLRCLLGITDFGGTIRVAGLDPIVDGPDVRALIGYMPQAGGLHQDLTVRETLEFHADVRRVPRSRTPALIADAGLDAHAESRVGDLSGGMRQRLGFAVALLSDPSILVLDEPTASLDAASREWLSSRLRHFANLGRTVIVSTHAGQELLASGDRRIHLEDGKLISDDRLGAGAHGVRSHASDSERPAAVAARAAAGCVRPIAFKELRDALRNRWLIGYATMLAVLGLAAAATGIDSSAGLALQAFGRTTATLMNLCLLLAPLVAVIMGAGAIAGEQERGTLEPLLAQPLTRTRLLLAKHVGLLLSLMLATVAGFLPAGVLVAIEAGPGVLPHYLLFPAIATLVGAAMLGAGLLLSVSSRTAVQAHGAAMFVWFVFVLLYDLLLMGTLAIGGMPVEFLAAMLAVNPVDAARVLGVLALEPDLYLLGPAGAYLTAHLSHAGTAVALLSALLAWAVVPLVAAMWRFRLPRRRRGWRLPADAAGRGVLECSEEGIS